MRKRLWVHKNIAQVIVDIGGSLTSLLQHLGCMLLGGPVGSQTFLQISGQLPNGTFLWKPGHVDTIWRSELSENKKFANARRCDGPKSKVGAIDSCIAAGQLECERKN